MQAGKNSYLVPEDDTDTDTDTDPGLAGGRPTGKSDNEIHPAAEPVIVAKNLTKWYGKVISLNQCSFTVGRGITGLVGPNGAGKSTLIKIILGHLRQNTGSIEVFGQKPWGNTKLLKRIGYCPEYDAFYEWMTGREFIYTLLMLGGMDRLTAEKETQKALELVMMGGDADRPIKTYSKGMRQRIKAAQAFAARPELIILDEPFSGTDPIIKHQLMKGIKKIAAEGSTILISTHILHELEQLTDTVLLIYQGRVLAQGKIGQIRSLIDNHPHLVVIRSSQNLRPLAVKLLEYPFVSSTRIVREGEIFVETDTPHLFYSSISSIISGSGIEVAEMFSPDDNLEAVFKYLVKG